MLSPEEQMRRVKAALAEAGYPNAAVRWDVDYENGGSPAVRIGFEKDDGEVPEEVCWKAFIVAGLEDVPCFECWSMGFLDFMPEDYVCTHESARSARNFVR